MIQHEILLKAFNQMPNTFTSNEFGNAARAAGYSKRRTKNGQLGMFLSRYADNEYRGSKTWTKKTAIDLIEPVRAASNLISFENEEKIIQYLKSKGYKIMKPTTNWEEI